MKTHNGTESENAPAEPSEAGSVQRLVRALFTLSAVSAFSHLMTWVIVVAAAVGAVGAYLDGERAAWPFMAFVGWCYVLRWEVAAKRSNS